MGLPTGSGRTTPPTIKIPDQGDSVTFAVVDCNPNALMYEYGTGEPVLNRRGQQKRQTVLTVLVVSGQGATIGGKDDARPVEAGDVGSIYVSGYGKWDPDEDRKGGTHLSFGAAVDKLPGGADAFDVGCVGQWKHLGELPSRGSFPRANRKFALRLPKPEEAAQTRCCKELHAELSGEGAPAHDDGGGGGGGGGWADEEPFIDLGFALDYRDLHREL